MEKLTTQDMALQWSMSLRRVQRYCSQGKIPGAEQKGHIWVIPGDILWPADGCKRMVFTPLEAPILPR